MFEPCSTLGGGTLKAAMLLTEILASFSDCSSYLTTDCPWTISACCACVSCVHVCAGVASEEQRANSNKPRRGRHPWNRVSSCQAFGTQLQLSKRNSLIGALSLSLSLSLSLCLSLSLIRKLSSSSESKSKVALANTRDKDNTRLWLAW